MTPTPSLAPLTTPFTQPPSCTSLWTLTSGTVTENYITRLLPILASDVSHPDFSSCQPSGYDSTINDENHEGEGEEEDVRGFNFSPAVCPESWTYYDMHEVTSWVERGRIAAIESVAYCCASGMTLRTIPNFPLASLRAPCYRSFEPGETTITVTLTLTQGDTATHLFTHGIQAHRPWTITWAASDTASLTPSLPSLTTRMTIPSWVPGQTVPAELYEGSWGPNDGLKFGASFYGVVIGVPVGVVVIVCVGVWACVSARRASKRELVERLTRELRRVEGAEGTNGK